MKKKKMIKANELINLGLAIMYEYWYDNIKPKYDDNVRLCIWIRIVL